ncbi:HTH domain-containing protein [Pedobacter frigiditerrae]|uniref:HTH domain-containing protein n=1 Tax=Pedobacter frigiditerrae TaxID=2530452 RepID=A0A4R0N2Y1_9SPHI|nr:HTH domain-containing protein [Pedobacter frigiditerrae]
MSIARRRQKLQKLLFMLKHKQVQTAAAVAQQLHCHPSTVVKLLYRLRKDGYQITYDKSLKRYVLVEEG